MAPAEPTNQTTRRAGGTRRSTPFDGPLREESRLLRWDATLRRAAAEEQRAEAANERAEAARQRAEAAHERAAVAHMRADTARERMVTVREDLDRFLDSLTAAVPAIEVNNHGARADERDHVADERDRIANHRDTAADERDAEADERERLADEREAVADERERLAQEQEAAQGTDRDGSPEPAASAAPETPEDPRAHYLRLVDEGAGLRVEAAATALSLADEAESIAASFEASAQREGRDWRLKIAATEREIAKALRRNAARLQGTDATKDPLEHLPHFPAR